MTSTQFTALIRLPFPRGSFVDPPQAQWDAEKDRQLWKVISKSSKTSDLNWVELASKFQVPPTFLLQQAAWLYERHFEHVRNQMKKVSGSSVNAPAASGGSTLTPVGGFAMQRAGSGGAGPPRTTSALSGHRKNSPSLGLQDPVEPGATLTRTPSTTTITQSRAQAQQLPTRTLSARSSQRPGLARPFKDHRPVSPGTATHTAVQEPPDSPEIPASSSSSSSSLSDADHPAHRSQLFKRPPRFQQKRPRELAPFAEGDGTQEGDDAGSQGNTMLPFASTARRTPVTSRQSQSEQRTRLADRPKAAAVAKQSSPQSQVTTETASSMTSSTSASEAASGAQAAAKSPVSPNFSHRTAMANLGSPRAQALRRKEGSEGTPSMGSSFSDIDDAGISQSALEEALLSNMQHGRMSTLSRMSHACFSFMMEQPTTRVGDASTPTPALTLRYTSGENELDLKSIYTDIYSLLEHPGRARLDQSDKFVPCSDAFLDYFWSAAAALLDYFADFYTSDTALMQSVWFHLLDVWQQASPTQLLDEFDLNDVNLASARELEQDFKGTIALVQRLISSKSATQPEAPVDPIIHCPSGEAAGPAGGWYGTGPFISGLKPWQQFLYAGGPGFRPPSPEPSMDVNSDSDMDVNTAICTSATTRPEATPSRYLPQPAIALVHTHTARARSLTAKVADTLVSWDTREALSAFDAHALCFPTQPHGSHACRSLTHPGTVRTYQLAQGAPRVRRHEGLTDPSMLVEDPGFVLLDDGVGVCRGAEAYVPVTGPVGRAGVGFDVWRVVESREGWRGGREGAFGEMFEEWEGVEEDEE
ncbi:hypothetical protein SVAN01_11022 [Stagonosporopsis vannaccii]|nr:hypothetical protein SVAN01_11022 [Stagonosporopsis vannaccii]